MKRLGKLLLIAISCVALILPIYAYWSLRSYVNSLRPDPVRDLSDALPSGGQSVDPSATRVMPQLAHPGGINTVAISPDGRLGLSGGDGVLRLWELSSGIELRSFKAHTRDVTVAAFSPDGRVILSGSSDTTVRLWDTTTGRLLRTFKKKQQVLSLLSEITSAAFTPDGRYILTADISAKDGLMLWDANAGEQVRAMTGHTERISSITVSRDGRLAVTGSYDKTVRLWNIATGEEIRTFSGHTSSIYVAAISPDGRMILGGAGDGTVKLWETATGKELLTYRPDDKAVAAVAFSPDSRFALTGSTSSLRQSGAGRLQMRETGGGKKVINFEFPASYEGRHYRSKAVAFSPDGRFILSGGSDGMSLWNAATGSELRSFGKGLKEFNRAKFSSDGRLILSEANGEFQIWDAATGKALYGVLGFTAELSPDGRSQLSTGLKHRGIALSEAATGKVLRLLDPDRPDIVSSALSPDGRFALSGYEGGEAKLWDLSTGKELRVISGPPPVRPGSAMASVTAFSPDGRLALVGYSQDGIKLLELETGKEISITSARVSRYAGTIFSPDGRFVLAEDKADSKLWETATGKEAAGFDSVKLIRPAVFSPDSRYILSMNYHDEGEIRETATGRHKRTFNRHHGFVHAVAFSSDGRLALTGGDDTTIKLTDVSSGRELHTFRGHTSTIESVAFSPDGRTVLSASRDGTMRLWDVKTGRPLALLMGSKSDWLVLTPQGFFSSAQRDTATLAIVRGFEPTGIGQMHQSLFNPDLVREALAGDPEGEVRRAADVLNLEKVLDSGPPPAVEIISPATGTPETHDMASVTARLKDRGKGIGRIEWRVSGITAGVMEAPADAGAVYEVKRTLALDPGANQIEILAYEKRNLLASPPARITLQFKAVAETHKPNLHVLAIGINAYTDQGWIPPGTSQRLAFPPLKLAVADAKAVAAELRKAGEGLYGEVRVTEAMDANATAANLDQIIGRISAGMQPRDTFVLFAAAHGISVNGRYYMIPQDYQGGNDPAALARLAISQERLQDWLANRIKAKKAIILLDTCESGALVGGYTKSRTDVPAPEAAIGRLHEAIGRPVLTAAASGKPAFEGYKGHGVFTFAVMSALHHGDRNGNGQIELSELAEYVQTTVPQISVELGQAGRDKGVAVISMRGFNNDKQSAQFGSTGEDFSLVRQIP